MNEMGNNLELPIDFCCDEIRDGFYVSETMKRHWAALLLVLIEIDKICRRHNINWFADSGTLIGAVRHKGFIPWDDDIDIAMLRDDFELFLSYAKDELPEEYCIAYDDLRGTDRNPFINHKNPFCGISNTFRIRNDHAFLEKNYDCPFLTTIDIFPLDRLYTDKSKEEDRVKRAKLVYSTYWGIINNEFSEEDIKLLLPIIEKDNHVKIGLDNIKRELLRLFMDISKECKDDDFNEVAVMYEWVTNGKCKYNKSFYEQWVEIPFETIMMRVPANYVDVLHAYCGDYTIMVKGSAGHDFPSYGEHEKLYRDTFGKNPLRYTLKKEKFVPLENKKGTYEKISELFMLIRSLHGHAKDKAESDDWESVIAILQSCQNAAVSIGNALERKYGNGLKAVSLLEQYCEKLYEASVNWNDTARAEMDILLSDSEHEADELISNGKRDILLLPCKASWWSQLREVFLLLCNDKRNSINIIPIPYYYHDHEKMLGEISRDLEEFCKIDELDGAITNFDAYDLENRHPDMILIQFPYDDSSSTLGIPEMLYSSNLRQYTDKLVFVTFLNPDPPESDDDVASKAMLELVEQPAVFNSDLVIVGSEGLRDYYIKTLVSMTDSSLKEYWEDRICLKEDLLK